jgi:hypothetical protein
MHNTLDEDIPLAQDKPTAVDVFSHLVRSGIVERWLDADGLIEAPVHQIHVLNIVEVV